MFYSLWFYVSVENLDEDGRMDFEVIMKWYTIEWLRESSKWEFKKEII